MRRGPSRRYRDGLWRGGANKMEVYRKFKSRKGLSFELASLQNTLWQVSRVARRAI